MPNFLVSWGKPHLKKGPLGIGRENRLVRNIEGRIIFKKNKKLHKGALDSSLLFRRAEGLEFLSGFWKKREPVSNRKGPLFGDIPIKAGLLLLSPHQTSQDRPKTFLSKNLDHLYKIPCT